MPKDSIEAQIQERVSAFVEELGGLVRQAALEAVQEVLAGEAPAAPSRRTGGRKKKAARKGAPSKSKAAGGKRIRRSAADLKAISGDIIAFVKANQGSGAGAIAKGLGVATKELKRPVDELLEGKKLRKEGERRATKYFVGAGRRRAKATSKKRR